MRQCTGCRQPTFCILPPNILRQIVQNETERQRTALETLPASSTFRILLESRLKAPVAGAVAPVVVTVTRQLRRALFVAYNAQGSSDLTQYEACTGELGGTTV
jgi:hypothetical protein